MEAQAKRSAPPVPSLPGQCCSATHVSAARSLDVLLTPPVGLAPQRLLATLPQSHVHTDITPFHLSYK